MKLLLDTHIWIWSLAAPQHLTPRVLAALEAPTNELWLSPISTWEALLLIERKRIEVSGPRDRVIEELLAAIPRFEAPLTHAVAAESRRIHLRHQDPADRFLAATAIVYGLTLVTADTRLLESRQFPVLANR